MSNSEFDHYLALLGGLLRLSPAQRDEIANELRDHLEERLRELLDQGVSRRKAIEIALEEFGDAAGLASEFVQIFHRQRRRWMMRMTFGTAAVISAIVLIASAFWPDGRSGPSPRQVVAQEEAVGVASHVPVLSPTLDAADLRTEARLQERIAVDYLDISLQDVLDDLGFNSDLQFYTKRQKPDEFEIDTTTSVTMSLKDVPVEMVLELVLEDRGLTYVIRNGVILITTTADSESLAEVRVYNCRDLLEAYVDATAPKAVANDSLDSEFSPEPTADDEKRIHRSDESKPKPTSEAGDQSRLHSVPKDVLAQFGGGGGGFGGAGARGASSREEQLMNIIRIAVMPESWEDVGGPGTIGEFDGMIVIRHNPRAHRKVEQVLRMLRDASSQQGWENPSRGFGFSGGGGGF